MIKRVFVLICCLYITSGYSQQYAIKEVVKKNKAKGIDIHYPQFAYVSKPVSDKVNKVIRAAFYDYASVSLSEPLGKAIDAARIQTNGMGPNNPVKPNTTDEGRAANRRVELLVYDKDNKKKKNKK